MPTFQNYEYSYFELRSELDPDPIFFSAEPDPRKNILDPHPCN